jgi:hypothetical protein
MGGTCGHVQDSVATPLDSPAVFPAINSGHQLLPVPSLQPLPLLGSVGFLLAKHVKRLLFDQNKFCSEHSLLNLKKCTAKIIHAKITTFKRSVAWSLQETFDILVSTRLGKTKA